MPKKNQKNEKKIKVISVLSLSVLMLINTSCVGSFKLFNNVLKWNRGMSNNKFIEEVVFFFLWIFPVYEVCMLADIWVLNSMEFWTGKNPVAMEEGEIIEKNVFHNNKEYYVKATKNKVEITPKDSEKVTLDYNESENIWYAESSGRSIKLNESNINKFISQVY